MNKRVWVFQFKQEVERKGAEQASWYVGWYDLTGKRHCESCGSGARGENQADKRLRRLQGELDLGVHQPQSKKKWEDFRAEYAAKVLSLKAAGSVPIIKASLDHFERIINPVRMESLTTRIVDDFIAQRRKERGKKPESLVSAATINKDLRHVKAALRKAHEWCYIATVPRFHMVREPAKLPRYVTPEHFAVIYEKGCGRAEKPTWCGTQYTAKDWWRALIVTAYMTGLRIHEILSFRKEDLDLAKSQLITRWDDNKGKRDEIVPLHPVVLEHLRKIICDRKLVFSWGHDERELWDEFGRLQRAAGIHLPCSGKHQHTEACHVYGFHDFRRAFATANAARLKPAVLQKLMRHQSFKTTLGYINLTSHLDDAVKSMPVPDVLKPPLPTEEDDQEEGKKPGGDQPEA
jgi:integrase